MRHRQRGPILLCNRLTDATDQDVVDILLRYKPRFRKPVEANKWKWTLTLSPKLQAVLSDYLKKRKSERIRECWPKHLVVNADG